MPCACVLCLALMSSVCTTARRVGRYAAHASASACACAGSAAEEGSEGARGGGAGLAPLIARARCRVRAPWPVPASKISRGLLVSSSARGARGLRSSSETIRFASAG